MNRAALWIAGIAVTLGFHGALAVTYYVYQDGAIALSDKLRSQDGPKKDAPLLCKKGHRCAALEIQRKRRRPEEPPYQAPEMLEAAVVPAYGAIDPDDRKLPEIETFERPEVFEQGVALDKEPSAVEKIITSSDPMKALLDPKSKNALEKLISSEPVDPRARAKDLSRLTGFKDGEIGGQGTEERQGSIYSVKVAREIAKVFRTPPFIDEATLKKLQLKVMVQRLGLDGAINEFKVQSRSGDRSFDDAAMAAIKQFIPREGGTKTLPVPDPDVLRYINAKGLVITLDGRLMKR